MVLVAAALYGVLGAGSLSAGCALYVRETVAADNAAQTDSSKKKETTLLSNPHLWSMVSRRRAFAPVAVLFRC